MDTPIRSTQDSLTTREVAALLGVERRTVIRMVDRGVLRATRLHPTANRRFDRADVAALIEGVA